MGTPIYYYVDPSIAAKSGAGTIGSPYGDLQYALHQVRTNPGRNATHRDQLNVLAATDEILAATLDFATYGAPSTIAPCIFRGYTSVANDRGIGGISGNGSVTILAGTAKVHFIDMHLHSTGAAAILTLGSAGSVQFCEVDNTTGNGVMGGGTLGTLLYGCHVHNIGVTGTAVARCLYNYFANGTNDFTTCWVATGNLSECSHNIFSVDGATICINLNREYQVARSNSILSASGTGVGIDIGTNRENLVCLDNVVEGFIGAGGRGFDGGNASEGFGIFAGNAAFNNTTDYANDADVVFTDDNEVLGATPFDKAGADTFANRFTYFAPVAAIQGTLYAGNRQDKGAVQHADPAGGGGGSPNLFHGLYG